MEKRILGDYHIVKQIGVGTLGSVYLAEHRFLRRHFALKILPEELSSDRGFVARFEKEVAVLASLDHPHIVKVHNISFADGYYFLVMDCIVDQVGETTNLSEYLSVHKAALKENEYYNILFSIASALDYAHSKQIAGQPLIHRDLKLNNILIGVKDRQIHPVITDFGLARVIGEGSILTRIYKNLSDAMGVELTDRYTPAVDTIKLNKLHGSFVQCYSFLAPEQRLCEDLQHLSIKADVYAFGVLAYYLLMRKYPEGVFSMPSTLGLGFQMDWDRLVTSCLQLQSHNRPNLLVPLMQEITRKPQVERQPAPVATPVREEPKAAPSAPADKEMKKISFASYFDRPLAGGMLSVNESSSHEEAEEQNVKTAVLDVPGYDTYVEPENVFKTPTELKPVLKPTEIERPVYDPDPAAIFQLESTVARYVPEQTENKEVEPLLCKMMVIPGGDYQRGNNEGGRDERPAHFITVPSFAMDIHPVTNEQFSRFLEVMGGEKDANNNDIIRLRESRIKRSGGKLIIESGYAKHPVVGVSWYGATAYAKWVGKRLPTEAEWEIVARAGSDVVYPTGSNIERTQANFFSADTISVMSYAPNPFGIYDLAGNVYEWCQDWYDYTYYEVSAQEPDNPKGPHQGVYRVLRGGCWKSLKDDLRCTHRHRNNPGTVNKTYGFRCAADVN